MSSTAMSVTPPPNGEPDIVVTGAALADARGERAYDVVRIDRARLETSATNRLEDILRDVAGFAQFRRSTSTSAQPTSQGATLRGLGGNASSRALLTLDGVPFTDPFGGWITYSALDPRRLGSISVTRGGGSGVAGPGALAGTIALSSATAGELAPLWGDVAYGSRDSIDAHAGASIEGGGGFGFLSAAYQRGDGFVPVIREDRGPVDIAAPYEQASISGRAVFAIGGASELQASMLGFYDHRTRGSAFTPNSTKGADVSLRLVGRGTWGYEALVYGQFRDFSAGFATINAARTTATPSLDQYEVPSNGIGGRFELRPPIGDRFHLRIGADNRYVTGETDEYYQYTGLSPANRRGAGGRSLTVGGFVEADADPLNGLTLTAGGRIDRWRIIDGFLRQNTLATGAVLAGTTSYPNRSGWRPTARGGVAYRPGGSAVTIRGAAYLGWRLPTLNELYRPFRVGQDSTVANAALTPERLKGIDGSVDLDPLAGLHLSATGFYNRLGDAIGNVTPLGLPRTASCPGLAVIGRCYQRQNLRAVVSQGAEFDARLAIGAWSLNASYAFADAHVDAPGQVNDGLRPAQTARHQASATLAWSPPPARLSATVRYVGSQYEDDLNTLRLRGAVTFDAAALVPIGHDLSVELRGENIGNARVEAGISGANVTERATPRTVWIGMRFGQRRDRS